MPTPEEALARIEAVVGVGLRLARSTTTGRMALAKLAVHLDPRWIPGPTRRPLLEAIEAATASPPPALRFPEVESILREAWGVRRVSAVLDSLESEPAAVRLTSQVHRGVHQGAAVAVKVLRPGVAAAVRQDLALLDSLLTPLRGAFPALDPVAVFGELRERVLDELDLEHEAGQMRRFARALRGGGPVRVPTPVTDLCHETVLVASWIDGEPLSGGVGLWADTTATALLRFVVGGLREGLVHCDLEPDDVLVGPDGSVGVVDFGAAVGFDRGRADLALEVVRAFVADDADALDAGLAALGLLDPGHGEAALTVARTVLGELGGAEPVRLDADAVVQLLRRGSEVEAQAVELILAGRLDPRDVWPGRGVGQLFALIARQGATAPWRPLVERALTDGWSG